MHLAALMITIGLGLAGVLLPQSVEEIISKVQSNVQSLHASRTELDCRERRTALSVRNGTTSLTWSVETDIVRAENGRPSRVLVSAEGKVSDSVLKSDSPYGIEELFGTAEHIFLMPYSDARQFKLAGSENLNGRPAFVLEFEAKPRNFMREYGKAWVDKDSFQVIRVENHLINGTIDPFTIEELGTADVGGKEYWLPAKRTIETRSNDAAGAKMLEISERVRCRRFEVSVKVTPVR